MMIDAKTRIEDAAVELGLTMTAVFVPFSKSRNAGEKHPSLNWLVTFHRNGREVITMDYVAGSGHCPAYRATVREMGNQNSLLRQEVIRWECEHGTPGRHNGGLSGVGKSGQPPILPEFADVLGCLVHDADAIDSGSFEDWADDRGYDPDSRKAEATYRACLEIALKLQAALGEEGLEKLREAAQDY